MTGPDRVLKRAELRPLSGREEEWLARHRNVPSAIGTTRVLMACLVRLDGVPVDPPLVRRLLVGDRDYLMLAVRTLTFGQLFQAVARCPFCRERIDISFQADETPVQPAPCLQPDYLVALQHAGRAREIRVRLPTGEDQEAVLGLDPITAEASLLDRCIVSDCGTPLQPEERAQVEAAIEHYAPRLELELDLRCPHCTGTFELPFDTTAFFLEEIRASTRSLMREVHSLAFHYHWSEADILGLDRGRRRMYLSLLSDELRGARAT